MRTIIDLPAKQVAALSDFCAREKISRAEAIRRAVESLLASRGKTLRETAFGTWAPRGDSRAVVDALRSEWE
jgi:metal-responsive CopG/Arc/MetJ family transcriptional regulator